VVALILTLSFVVWNFWRENDKEYAKTPKPKVFGQLIQTTDSWLRFLFVLGFVWLPSNKVNRENLVKIYSI
jgi:hypothetical protein